MEKPNCLLTIISSSQFAHEFNESDAYIVYVHMATTIRSRRRPLDFSPQM